MDLPARLVIAGPPRAGKTTLARGVRALGLGPGARMVATDDYKGLGWSEASTRVAAMLAARESWIAEGVAMPRVLRKMLEANPRTKPADVVVWLPSPRAELSRGQSAMAKGVDAVWREVEPKLRALGVEVLTPGPAAPAWLRFFGGT